MTAERPQLDRLRDHMQPRIDFEAARPGVLVRVRRRRRRRRLAAGAAGGLVVLLGLFLATGRGPSEPPRPTVAQVSLQTTVEGANALTLADGARIVGQSAAARLRVDARTDLVEVRVEAGGADFDVPPDRAPRRPYRVRAGEVEVEVVGTRFSVAHAERGAVRVHVEHGRVRVRYAGGERFVGAGEGARFGPDATTEDGSAGDETAPSDSEPGVEPEDQAEAEPAPRPEPARRAASKRPRRRARRGEISSEPRWRVLAEEGRFEEAARALEHGRWTLGTPDELMLAADAMRLARRPQAARRYLDRVVREHPDDRRVPLALFTKARLLAATDPRGAARTFAQVYAHPGAGALAEDALAREVEAWSKIGDTTRARSRARLYLRRYPKGHRRAAVRAFSGLEP